MNAILFDLRLIMSNVICESTDNMQELENYVPSVQSNDYCCLS